jgi:hypothetical protein
MVPILVEFGLTANDLPDDEADNSVKLDKPQDKLMRQHIWLGHLPFFKLKALAKIGTLPHKIIHPGHPSAPPVCIPKLPSALGDSAALKDLNWSNPELLQLRESASRSISSG